MSRGLCYIRRLLQSVSCFVAACNPDFPVPKLNIRNRDKQMPGDDKQHEYPSSGYSWYVVAVLTLAYVFSFIDRQIMSFLVGPIRSDLEISDTQMSLLMGASFAIFYTLFGIPLGRLADTRSRRAIIALGITLWSIMTAGCGIAKTFYQLALMRMGVGVGEATLSPAAYSLIADYFPPHRRSTAMSVYSMGIYIGSGLAFILGGMVVDFVTPKTFEFPPIAAMGIYSTHICTGSGVPIVFSPGGVFSEFATVQESVKFPLIGDVRSWQLVFFLVGLPGLLVALLLLTVREPVRQGGVRDGQPAPRTATLSETRAYIFDNLTTFFCLNVGIALLTLSAYAGTSWIPSLFMRRFDWSPGTTGLVYGSVMAISGTCGVLTGGWLADWWSQLGRVDATVRVAWLCTICLLPFGILYPLAPTGTSTAVLLIPTVFFGSMPYGVVPAAIQRMMPNTMRAQATAIYLFVINIVGMGLGPTAAALLTEHVFGDKKLVNYSLLVVGVGSYLVAIVLLGISLKSYRGSLKYLESWNESRISEV